MTPILAKAPAPVLQGFAADVHADLARSPKQLQSKYLYDALGSSLFEAICRLPWYQITRAETRLLAERAEEILALLAEPVTIVELGCGSGEKVARLARALGRRGRLAQVHLIDISSRAIELSERTVRSLEHVSVVGHRATYEVGLRRAAARRQPRETMLVLLLGSNIGNFDSGPARDFLRAIRGSLRPGDALLLGADLVKPERDLLLAYNDPLGVTAAFNKNLLARINAELSAKFDLASFDHAALWNAAESRVEMHLVSRRAQTVRIPGAGCTVRFAEGESIWTESSYKYEPETVAAMAASAGFRCHEQWVETDARFALTLFLAD